MPQRRSRAFPRQDGAQCLACAHYQGQGEKDPSENPAEYDLHSEDITPESKEAFLDYLGATDEKGNFLHYIETCSAFPVPGGIPQEYWSCQRDHTRSEASDSKIQFVPRFPIIYHTQDQWSNYCDWAKGISLPHRDITLFAAWQPIVEKGFDYLAPPKSDEAIEFLKKVLDDITANHKEDEEIVQLLKNLRSLLHDYLKGVKVFKPKVFNRSELGYHRASLFAYIVLAFQKQTLRLDDSETLNDLHLGYDEDRLKKLFRAALLRNLLANKSKPLLEEDTLYVLSEHFTFRDSSHRMMLLSNGLSYPSPSALKKRIQRLTP